MADKFPWGRSLIKWAGGWLSGGPHFVVGNQQLLRWYVLPRNPWLNIYLHKFQHDDEDRALHDHPWWFVSILLRGRYSEVVFVPGYEPLVQYIHRRAPSIAFRPAVHKHRVTLPHNTNGTLHPAWTVVITGKVTRVWGFWCPQGWVKWSDFLQKGDDYGQTGRGCGEHG